MSIKSTAALAYCLTFGLQVPPECKRAIGGPEWLRSTVSVFYYSERSDLDCALVYDLLQKSGVVSNDRWIREKHEYWGLDKDNPRCEIIIEAL